VSQRTTLTLDDDVADGLRREAQRAGRPYREVVNATLRRGLRIPDDKTAFRVKAANLGRRPGVEIDDIEGLLDLLDDPPRR
jgi:hypothetical protein